MRRTALLVGALTIAPGCAKLKDELATTQTKLAQTEQRLARVSSERDGLRAENQSYEARVGELQTELAQLQTQIETLAQQQGITAAELAELRADKAKRERELKVYRDLFAQLKKLVDAGTIEVVFRKGRMTVKLSNAILFDSGKTKLRPEGGAAVAAIVPALLTVGQREFLVAGHTDNVPINTARYKSNWELSTARAVTMVNAMVGFGYPPGRLGAAGFGEYDPTADNANDRGREQNRRIEIILMPNLGEIPGMKNLLKGAQPGS